MGKRIVVVDGDHLLFDPTVVTVYDLEFLGSPQADPVEVAGAVRDLLESRMSGAVDAARRLQHVLADRNRCVWCGAGEPQQRNRWGVWEDDDDACSWSPAGVHEHTVPAGDQMRWRVLDTTAPDHVPADGAPVSGTDEGSEEMGGLTWVNPHEKHPVSGGDVTVTSLGGV